MLTCKEAIRLVSEDLDRRLSIWSRLQLRLHVMMCDACTAYRRQLGALHRAIQLRLAVVTRPSDPLRLSPATRDAIRRLKYENWRPELH